MGTAPPRHRERSAGGGHRSGGEGLLRFTQRWVLQLSHAETLLIGISTLQTLKETASSCLYTVF